MEIVPGLTGEHRDSFCHRKATPPWGREGIAVSAYLLVMCELGSPKCRVPTGGQTGNSPVKLPASIYLFIYPTSARFCQYLQSWYFYPTIPPPPLPLPKGWGLSKGHPENPGCGSIYCDGTKRRQTGNKLLSEPCNDHHPHHPHQAQISSSRQASANSVWWPVHLNLTVVLAGRKNGL